MKSYQHLRHLALSAACLFCGLWLSTAQPVPPTSSTSQFNGSQSNGNQSSGSQSTATLQGAAALDQLKQTGQFTSLQAAMQQARRSVSHADKTPLGRPAWYAPNRAAGYDAYVHEEGVSLVLGDASQVGLRLAGLGYGTDLHDVAAGVVSGEQQMINIERGTVREWYVNGAEGLEQGFTLNERPPSAIRHPPSAIPLRLALQVSAGWRAVPGADDQRVGLLNDAGAMLEYGKLAAWDAQGQTLPAALTVEGESIVIEVDDAQAVYPLTIDPIFTQQAKLSAPDAAANDGFGSAVALSGNTALISAPFDDVTFVDQGSAYVFVRSGSAWTFQAKLTATDGANSDRLGVSVALSGDTAVLGAAAKNAVYVFTRNGTSWSQQQKLTGNDGGFGVAVALSGESVIIGANFESISGFQTGAAYVFTRSGTTWTQQQKLTASDGAQGDNFGSAVALDGAVALVAASGDDIGAINNQGSVYVFARSGTVWTPQQKLLASDGAADDSFGFSVALSGDTAAVGAYLDDSGANINQGAAYIFTRVGTTWTQQQKLTASDGAANDFLGYSLALSGDVLIASALGDGFGATSGQGSLYVFARSGTTWTQQNKLFAADGVNGDNLGRAVALSGDTVLVGAAEDDGAFTNQGAAYVFALCNNNFVQQQKVFASDGAADDIFGYSIALSSDTLLVSAPRDDAGTVIDQGSAYVFLRNGTNWAFQQKLTFGNGFGGTYFGISVALDGETAVIGTNYDITQTNPSVAYVFTRNGANWSLQQTLTANDATAHSGFGGAVALRGDTIVVGAYNVSVGMQTGVGAAYVFTRSGGSWSQQQKLLANDGAQGDGFGRGVALSGDSLLVGAIRGDTPTQPNTGVAYVFTRSGASWSQQQKLFATDVAAGNNFGVDVALSGDSALVSTSVGTAYVFTRSDTNWTQQRKFGPFGGRLSIALSGDTAALGGNNEVKVFTRAGTVWTELPPLTASDEVAGNNFGESVALSGDTLAVGAISDDIGANVDQGSAYVFTCTACPAVTLNLASLPNAHVGTSYNQALTASGGTGPYQFSLSSGALPPGVELASSGLLFGTPTTTGTYSFTVTATILSSLCPGSRTYTLTVTPPCPTITVNPNNPTLLNGRAGVPYSQTFTQTGGTGAATFSVSAGALPNGLTLAAGGLLSGTPTVNGTFNFTVRATDTNECTGERAYTLLLLPPCPAITVNPATLPNGTIGTAYNQTLTATGGTAPYTFNVTSGSLPNGLTLASGGTLTGTPTTAGSFNFTVTATDNTGCTGTRAYTVTVSGTGLQFYPLPAPVRLLDTRAGEAACTQPSAPIAGQSSLTQMGRGLCNIPANAVALTGNLTTVQSGGGYLTLYPSNASQPTVASTNYGPNEIINNVFTVGLGTDGAFKIFAFFTTEVVVDVTGYYAPPSTGGLYFHPLPKPIRLLETRAGEVGCNAPGAPIQGGVAGTRTQQARLTCDGVTIPNGALAIVGNATTVGPQAGGYLTLFPANAAQPLVASSNYNAGQVVNGPFSVGLAPTGEFNIFTFATTHLVVDVLGYYSSEANDVNGAGLLFNPLPKPVRLLETRANQAVGCYLPGLPLISGVENTQPARGACDGVTIPANALGVVGNATVVTPNAAGFLTLWPSTALRPLVATANYNAGDIGNRHFIVGLGAGDGAFKLFSSATTELVIDLSGYFAP